MSLNATIECRCDCHRWPGVHHVAPCCGAPPYEMRLDEERRTSEHIASLTADVERLSGEVERLRAVLTGAVDELDPCHQPEWVSPEAQAAGKDPWVCHLCGAADGGWPCDTRRVIDEMRAAVPYQEEP